jgi:hypothetical protein
MPLPNGMPSMMDAILAGEKVSFQIMDDMTPYVSPVNGQRINSRSSHADHLKEYNLQEVGNEKPDWMKRRDEEAKAKAE